MRGCWCLGSSVFVLLCFCVVHVSGHPSFFVESYANSCSDHPPSGYGSAHGGGATAAQPDAGISFQLAPAAGGAATTRLCPGSAYDVKVAYGGGQAREGLLTASVGKFEGADASCPGRVASAEGEKSSAWQTRLKLPCGASGSVELKETSASGSKGGYKTATATLPIDAACAAQGAHGANHASPIYDSSWYTDREIGFCSRAAHCCSQLPLATFG